MPLTMHDTTTTSPHTDARLDTLRAALTRAIDRVCPPWLAAQRDDIVQGALLRLLPVLERREGNDPLAASYLWKVGYTATVDEIRRRRRLREECLVDSRAEAMPATGPSPDAEVTARETRAALQACLATLVEARRSAVTLHLLGHNVPEIAKRLDWPAKRTDNAVYRGLADLRACLRAKGVEP
jgi:RNA polymerase sigma-70 factor, ECF subfamily